jgi:8-oxo-dGTP diphosphatase
MAELWDLYDERGELTGETIERGTPLPPGRFHLIIHIWLVASDGSLLIQKRNKPGGWTHGLWAPTAGSITAGEDSRVGAVRECGEEVGIAPAAADLRFHEREFIDDFIQDVWIAPWDGDMSAVRIDPAEVLEARSVRWDQIISMVAAGEFLDYGKEYFRRLRPALFSAI